MQITGTQNLETTSTGGPKSQWDCARWFRYSSRSSIGLGLESEDKVLKEVKRSRELGRIFGLSAPNKIDAIWVKAKNQRLRKGKKNENSKGTRCGRKESKAKD